MLQAAPTAHCPTAHIPQLPVTVCVTVPCCPRTADLAISCYQAPLAPAAVAIDI